MPKPSSRRWFERVSQELEKGHIEERPIKQIRDKEFVFGHIEDDDKKIAINPVVSMVEPLIHELLHRLYPHWKEPYVKAKTSEIMRTTSAEEKKALFERYQQIARKVKKTKVVK